MCSLAEYREYEAERLFEDEFEHQQPYFCFVALEKNAMGKEAAVGWSMVRGQARLAGGLLVARLAFLDLEYQPLAETDALFEDGYWVQPQRIQFAGVPPVQGYLLDVEDGCDIELQEMFASRELVAV